jgi:hypothetical protein
MNGKNSRIERRIGLQALGISPENAAGIPRPSILSVLSGRTKMCAPTLRTVRIPNNAQPRMVSTASAFQVGQFHATHQSSRTLYKVCRRRVKKIRPALVHLRRHHHVFRPEIPVVDSRTGAPDAVHLWSPDWRKVRKPK